MILRMFYSLIKLICCSSFRFANTGGRILVTCIVTMFLSKGV